MTSAKALAKINLALVVGAPRVDGKHDVVTLMQSIDLYDTLTLERADDLAVEGFDDDTIVRAALESLAGAAGVEPRWRVQIVKRIPVAAGLGGGSSDAAASLRLANATLAQPLDTSVLHTLASGLGADVPFFLREGPQLATADGTELASVELPSDYSIVLVLPDGETKESTAAVYAAFDARGGEQGYADRAAVAHRALAALRVARDLSGLPPNDLTSSPVAARLHDEGAFRADVSGAGPAVYGLFEREPDAIRAAEALAPLGRTIVTRPIGAAGRT